MYYKYFIREKTHVSGYIYSLDGGQIPNESGITDNQLQDGDYIYVITNEKLSPTDHRTHIDIEKEWKDNEGNPEMEDIDLHKDDFITFKVVQKKYEAKVTLKDGTTRMLYPITVNLDDKNANNQGSRVSHKTVVYVPEGASFTIAPIILAPLLLLPILSTQWRQSVFLWIPKHLTRPKHIMIRTESIIIPGLSLPLMK